MRRFIALCLVSLVVSAGVAPAVAANGDAVRSQQDTAVQSRPSDAVQSQQTDAPADPDSDVIGWENGYWHNESIDVDQSDGLSDAELEAYVARSMARVEHLREREFKRPVPVSVISREAYRKRSANNTKTNESFEAWNNQVWEALFITGEKKNVQKELGSTLGSSVAGFYSSKDDEIKIVTDSPDKAVIDNATLHHELVHALQDQYQDLSSDTYAGETQDGDLAIDGIVEGEARYVEYLYVEKCGGEWQCVETPKSGGNGGSGSESGGGLNLGIYLVIFQPYSDGPPFVHNLKQRGGWQAVEERFANPPVSSEQVIHDTDEKPVPIEFTDRSTNGWSLFEHGQDGSDTVGEASLYAMFWYQDREGTNGFGGFDWQRVGNTDGKYDRLNYDSKPTAGWANDRVFPYKKGSGNDTEYGYVWKLKWDTKKDATQFRETYTTMLNAHDAVRKQNGVYVIEEGEFADAFRVSQQGQTVTIVNAPTASDLSDIRPTNDQSDGGDGAGGGDNTDGSDGETTSSTPGFGFLTALVALIVALIALAGTARFGRR